MIKVTTKKRKMISKTEGKRVSPGRPLRPTATTSAAPIAQSLPLPRPTAAGPTVEMPRARCLRLRLRRRAGAVRVRVRVQTAARASLSGPDRPCVRACVRATASDGIST